MATLTGELISETYDSLLKVTDNNTITGIKKRITDGFGNEIPLLFSSTDIQIDGKLILSALSDLEAGEKFLILYPDNSVGYRTSSEVLSDIGGASSSSISGIINQIAKFDTTGSVTSSIITEVDNKVGIDLSLPNNKLSVNVDLPNSGIDLQSGGTTYARFGIISPGIPGEPGTDNDCYIGSTINNDFLIRVNNTEALRIDTALRLKIANIQNAVTDTDKFLVSDGGIVKYRSGLEMLSDLGAVPYTGATNDVDLGIHDLTTNSITLNPAPSTIPTSQGSMYFDSADQTVAAVLNGTIMKIGEDLFFQIKNQSGSTIPKGTAVRFDGVVGASGRIKAVPFIANGSVPSIYFLGVTSEDIPNGGDGKAFYFGKIRGMNTNAYPAGTILYASTTVAGGFQTTAPIAPNNIISVAAVTTQGTSNGTILVRPLIGSNINNDEGVRITGATTGDLLQLQASGLWENKSANNAGLVDLAGTQTITGAKTFTNGIILGTTGVDAYTISADGLAKSKFNFNGKSFIFDASTIPALATLTYSMPSSSGTLALTSQLHDAVTIGTANGLSLIGQVLSLGLANGVNNGALRATDWTTFNNKQNALSIVTPLYLVGNTLQMYQANSTTSGFLYNVDWNTFNNKVGGSGTTSYIPKFTASNTIGNSQIFETASGININSTTDAGYKLDVNGTGRFSGTLTGASSIFTNILVNATGLGVQVNGVTGNPAYYVTDQSVNNAGKRWRFGHTGAIGGFSSFDIYNQTDNITALTLSSTGAATFSSSVTAGGFSINSNGTISSNGFWGTLHTKGAGSYSDWSLINSGGSGIMWNPTGTLNMSFAGNVLIGTTSDTGAKLRVEGGVIRSISTYDNTTATAANLVVSAGGTFERSTSSLKYKKDVRDYDKGLEVLMNMRPVYYKGKSENDGDTQFAGLIAEEVHDLGLTEFVQYANDGSPDALAYTHMNALLIKAIQELKAEIDTLKNN